MPQYIIYFIAPDRASANEAKDDDKKELYASPSFQKMMQSFLSWIEAEIKAERLTNGAFLLPSSPETNIRINFHDPDLKPDLEPKQDEDAKPNTEQKQDQDPKPATEQNHEQEHASKQDDEPPALHPPSSTITRESAMSADILCYYNASFPTLSAMISWAQSCPISYPGFALEIRELKDTNASITEAPAQVREWVGDQVVSVRKQLLAEGKMRKDEDGTLWARVEEEVGVKEVVREAEERTERKDEE